MSLNTMVIGLGSLGYGMARSCLRAGHRVSGRDVTPQRAQQCVSDGGHDGPMEDPDAIVVVVMDAPTATRFDATITQSALGQYRKAVEMGLAGADDAAVAQVYARANGLTLPGEGA